MATWPDGPPPPYYNNTWKHGGLVTEPKKIPNESTRNYRKPQGPANHTHARWMEFCITQGGKTMGRNLHSATFVAEFLNSLREARPLNTNTAFTIDDRLQHEYLRNRHRHQGGHTTTQSGGWQENSNRGGGYHARGNHKGTKGHRCRDCGYHYWCPRPACAMPYCRNCPHTH